MATKTISIDVAAYRRLKSVKKENESFSEVIKRVVWVREDFEAAINHLEKSPLSNKAIDAIEKVVASGKNVRSVLRQGK